MDDRRIDSFLPLHPDAFRILVSLREEERHGYAIVKELESDPARPGRIMPANLYRRIRWLADKGLITEAESRPAADDEDQRRRYFRLSALGEAVARAEAERLQSLVSRAADFLAS